MPTTLDVDVGDAGRYHTIRWTGRVGEHPCLNEGAEDVGGMLECGTYIVRGESVPAQHTPCAAMDQPYVQLMLNRKYDGQVILSMLAADGVEYEVYGSGCDLEGFALVERIDVLRPGANLTARPAKHCAACW